MNDDFDEEFDDAEDGFDLLDFYGAASEEELEDILDDFNFD